MSRNLNDYIDKSHLAAYLARELSSAQVARLYGVKPAYVTRTLPKRERRPPEDLTAKTTLRRARNEYRDALARRLDRNEMTAEEVAATAHCSVRTVYRHLRKVRHAG